jgi:hypothetical protein
MLRESVTQGSPRLACCNVVGAQASPSGKTSRAKYQLVRNVIISALLPLTRENYPSLEWEVLHDDSYSEKEPPHQEKPPALARDKPG